MVHIRPATEADFTSILQVQQAAFGEYTNVYQVSGWTTETLDSLKEDAKEGAFKILTQQLVKSMSRAVPVQDFSWPIVEHRLHTFNLAP